MPTLVSSFWIKAALAAALVVAADLLFWRADGVGANLGIFAAGWVVALAVARPAIFRNPLARTALAVAAGLALVQVERASLVGALLFVLAIAVAALAPRAPAGQDGWRWAQRIVMGGLKGLVGPALDLRLLLRARARNGPVRVILIVAGAVLPVVGGIVFLSLFAAANPVIGDVFASWRLPEFAPVRALVWAAAGLLVWAALRPRGLRRTLTTPGLDGDLAIPGVGTASITASLVLFNLIFALQNGLDLAYLWGGAGLPPGVTFAEYAHRGAYPLIATALLAGLFVVIFLRPSSATAANRSVRGLVTLWIAQNLLLVASTALRTLDYVEVYSLTRLRIAALMWMGLVALGLVLIAWRLLRSKSSAWLINANLTAAGAVVLLCSVMDLGAVSAAWNVRHAREVGGAGVSLDLCYMDRTGGAALVSLADLEAGLPSGDLRERVAWKRRQIMQRVMERQEDWHTWRWRDARRLARAWAVAPGGTADPWPGARDCDGRRVAPPPPKPAPPLTAVPNPGT